MTWPNATVSHLNLYANSVLFRSPSTHGLGDSLCTRGEEGGLVEGIFMLNLL